MVRIAAAISGFRSDALLLHSSTVHGEYHIRITIKPYARRDSKPVSARDLQLRISPVGALDRRRGPRIPQAKPIA
jgi:hypothetical protein